MGRGPRPDLAARNRANANPNAPIHHPLFMVWKSMVARCHSPTSKDWPRYGGRGIAVCNSWRVGVFAFAADMGERPSPKHQIDRINNDGNYEPANCRWATVAEQSRNRRSTKLITFNGETMCLRDWSLRTGLCRVLITHRIRAGWSLADALTLPADRSANHRRGRKAA